MRTRHRQPLRLEILEAVIIALCLGLLVAGTSEAADADASPVTSFGPGFHIPVSAGSVDPVARYSASNDSAPATGVHPCIDGGAVAASTTTPVTGRPITSSAQGRNR